MKNRKRSRRIVFLAVNSSYAHTSLAAWYLRAFVCDLGWKWETVEMIANEDIHAALNRISTIGPAVLAATCYVFNRNTVLSVLRRYRTIDPSCVVLAGGPEFLGDNRAFVERENCVDAVVRGEGEDAFRRLLRCSGRRDKWRSVPGVCAMIDGQYVDNGHSEEVRNLEDIPSPYTRELRPSAALPGCQSRPAFAKPFVQIETSRGCRNRCAFCSSGNSGTVRYFPVRRIRSDLMKIRAAGVLNVRVLDRTFNDGAVRPAKLLKMFREDFHDMNFHLEIDPAKAGTAILRELAAARPGQFHLDVGVQTFDVEVTGKAGRTGSEKGVLRGLSRLCGLENIAVHADLIAGLPGATLQRTCDDLRRLVAMRPAEIQLEMLKVLPGTRLSREAGTLGLAASPEPPYEVLKTGCMTAREAYEAHMLCRLVDWFYEPASLRETVCRANNSIPFFWRKLVHFCLRNAPGGCTTGGSPSLENRFRLLEQFFTTRGPADTAEDPAAYRPDGGTSTAEAVGGSVCGPSRRMPLVYSLRYAWMKYGLSPSGGICVTRPWKGPLPAGAVLVEGERSAEISRMYSVHLDRTYIFAYGRTDKGRQAAAIYWTA